MNKNITIGVLVVLVLIGVGVYLFKGSTPVTPVENTTIINGTPTETAPPVTDTSTSTPAAPIVQTSQNVSTSTSTAAVGGSVKPNGASTTYWFEYGTTTAFGNQTTSQSIGGVYSAISATGFISGLRANTTYYYRLSAKNKFATTNGTMYTLQTNDTPAPKVIAPTVRTSNATNVSRTAATINGQINPNGTSTNYWYEYGTDTNFGRVTQFLSTNAGTTAMSVPIAISDLQPLTRYYFRLNAQNQFGTVNGAVANFTTTGPSATTAKPSINTSNATNISSTEATLVGQIKPNGSDTTYHFEYSTDSLLSILIGGVSTEQTVLGGVNSQTVKIAVNGLQSNTKYYYRLVGRNQNGTVSGNIVSFSTKR